MRASRLEYRFRFLLHGLIYTLGFSTPWNSWLHLDHYRTTWECVATWIAGHRWLNPEPSFQVVLVAAIALLALGAWFRVWGTAYVGANVVASGSMHGQAMLADGPYRRTRNPLYLGTILHTVGLSLLMRPTGAIFCIVFIWVLQVRLALAEEPFLAARFGQPYLEYCARVPRFLPIPAPQVPAAGRKARWPQAFLGEFYFVAVVVVLAVWGWQYNAQPIIRGVLISLGIWIIIFALLPRPKAQPAAA